jgi:PAS domain-containing protein
MAALESAPDYTVMLDPQGRNLFANRSFRGLIFDETGKYRFGREDARFIASRKRGYFFSKIGAN